MIGPREIAYSIYGAWRLAHFDKSGMDYFDDTLQAFWRSFWVAIIVLPGIVAIDLYQYDYTKAVGGPARIAAVQLGFYAVGWALYPLVMFYVTGFIGKERSYVRYIVAYNWASVLVVALYLLLILLFAAFGAASETEIAVAALVRLVVFAYAWFIAKTALGLDGLSAVALVFLDFVLNRILLGIEHTMVF